MTNNTIEIQKLKISKMKIFPFICNEWLNYVLTESSIIVSHVDQLIFFKVIFYY